MLACYPLRCFRPHPPVCPLPSPLPHLPSYGDELRLAGFGAVLQALVSYVEATGDMLRAVTAGRHQVGGRGGQLGSIMLLACGGTDSLPMNGTCGLQVEWVDATGDRLRAIAAGRHQVVQTSLCMHEACNSCIRTSSPCRLMPPCSRCLSLTPGPPCMADRVPLCFSPSTSIHVASLTHLPASSCSMLSSAPLQVVFLSRGPFYLVAISSCGEPLPILECQLDHLYNLVS